jgi:hypothetical protein
MEAKELQELIKKELKYTTNGFIWNTSRPNVSNTKKCGHIDEQGYKKITIMRKNYREDLLVWVLFTGRYPDRLIHLDKNRLNSRISNIKNVKSISNLTPYPKNTNDNNLLRKVCFERFYYKDGHLYYREHSPMQDTIIGNLSCGYHSCNIDKSNYLIHRLIYLMFYGELPELVDHIDRDSTNNRIENLRKADKKINSINRGLQANNKSGHKGVSWNRNSSKWEIYITVNNKRIALGLREKLEDAIILRKEAENKYFGYCQDTYYLESL